ncbi:MAG TPA: DUF2975 domain-containing protein [Feifaniaceae bacterium]|nr:DUF2975 domain-containing protein [Feifaniaceae bacterium]
MKKPALLNTVTLVLLYVTMALGAAFIVMLPRLLPFILFTPDPAPEFTPAYSAALVCWILGALFGLFILFTLIRMMRSIQDDPFIRQNVLRLRNMGFAALVMAALTLIVLILYFRPMLFLILTAEVLCALFSLVLRGIFEKAVEYREENALTI